MRKEDWKRLTYMVWSLRTT